MNFAHRLQPERDVSYADDRPSKRRRDMRTSVDRPSATFVFDAALSTAIAADGEPQRKSLFRRARSRRTCSTR